MSSQHNRTVGSPIGGDRFTRRRVITAGAALLGGLAVGGTAILAAGESGADTVPTVPPRGARRALVYRGPAAGPGCAEAVAGLLQSSSSGFEVRYTGPQEDIPLTAASLATAALYAQPGGGELNDAYKVMRAHARDIEQYVARGGRYLGFCVGGYLAGHTPGFKLLPGDAGRFIGSPGASVTTQADTIVEVDWRGRRRHLYFQDGPAFSVTSGAQGVDVLARYTNGEIAALIAPHGSGRVGVVGPHPEATAEWYAAYHLHNPDGVDASFGHDLVDSVLRD